MRKWDMRIWGYEDIVKLLLNDDDSDVGEGMYRKLLGAGTIDDAS